MAMCEQTGDRWTARCTIKIPETQYNQVVYKLRLYLIFKQNLYSKGHFTSRSLPLSWVTNLFATRIIGKSSNLLLYKHVY